MMKLSFLFLVINTINIGFPISIHELHNHDTIIDINKGYALRRVGSYSSNIKEEIVHTFIPLTDFCVASPQTDICLYSSINTRTEIVSLGTIMKPRRVFHQVYYNRDVVSRDITNDLSRILLQNHLDDFVQNKKSMVHFVDNRFHYHDSNEEVSIKIKVNDSMTTYPPVSTLRPAPVKIILRQINNNKISFEHLPYDNLKTFLTTIFSMIDGSYSVLDVQQALYDFDQLIVGQSIHALRYCSLGQRNRSISQPCLVISTLFFRIPSESVSTFFIYRIIVLPIVHNDNTYTYSNIPKIIGINPSDQTFLLWRDEFDTDKCSFSTIVQCRTTPIPTSLSKASCLSQLLDDNESDTDLCQVTRSENIDTDVVRIDHGILLFSNIREASQCRIYSASNDSIESISITEPTIFRIPCNKTMRCPDFQIVPYACTQRRLLIKPSLQFHIQYETHFLGSIQNMARTILSSYQTQHAKMIAEWIEMSASKKSKIMLFLEESLMYTVSVLSLILVAVAYLIKRIKTNLENNMNCIESILEEIITS